MTNTPHASDSKGKEEKDDDDEEEEEDERLDCQKRRKRRETWREREKHGEKQIKRRNWELGDSLWAVGTERVESSITYDTREVVVYGHRQTQKKTPTLKNRVL